MSEQGKQANSTIEQESEENNPPGVDASSYTEPVSKLLTHSEVEHSQFPEVDYVKELGISTEDIPELIRMASDLQLASKEATDFQYTATLHAVKALEQLHAEEAIEPLMPLFNIAVKNNNEWLYESILPDFYSTLGAVALPALAKFITDANNNMEVRIFASSTLIVMEQKHPETHTACVEIVTRVLEKYEENDEDLNASMVGVLMDMKAVEAAPIIEKAYAADKVELSLCGDWNEVQYELGLKERPPEEERSFSSLESILQPRGSLSRLQPSQIEIIKEKHKVTGNNKKAKAKMIKASKKKNRRK